MIYRAAVGSRAFGLATEGSYEDIRGVYLPPAGITWSLQKPPEEWESRGGGRDEIYSIAAKSRWIAAGLTGKASMMLRR